MQIACPNCSTSYQIADSAIGDSGRSVRCARCKTVWFAAPAGAPSGTIEEPVPEPAAAAMVGQEPAGDDVSADMPGPAERPALPDGQPLDGEYESAATLGPAVTITDAPPLVPEPGADLEDGRADVESVAARRERAAARRRRARWRLPLSLVIIVLLILCGGLLVLRKDIVRHVPQMASLYASIGLPVNLRGLEFDDLKIGNEVHDGVPVLVVEGVIVNKVNTTVEVPRLRFALRNSSGAEIYMWTTLPAQTTLDAGARLPFRSRLAAPPAEGHDVQVRFFTSRDAVAGGR